MTARDALTGLLDALDRLELQLQDDHVIQFDPLLEACQNLQRFGQNFDRSSSSAPRGEEPRASTLELELLEWARGRLGQGIEQVSSTQNDIEARLRHIHRGSRGLNAYNCIQPITSHQYITRCL